MKKLVTFFVLIILLGACEKDDICVETLTPKLIIRFYDVNNPTETKDVSSLTVTSEGNTLINQQTTDSITLPLDVNNLQTSYTFTSNSLEDILTVTYGIDEIYVSRSCGFIANYNSLSINPNTNNWVQVIDIQSTTIENENTAHVQIRH